MTGLELPDTIKTYLKEDIVRVEFIILIAIIAIARKTIVWDFDKSSTNKRISLAGMILEPGFTFFLRKKADVRLTLKINIRSLKLLIYRFYRNFL